MELTINSRVFVTSDLHLNHRRLCSSYEDHFDIVRHYATTDEMNDDIVKQWNATVTDDDIVIFLGDTMMNTPGSQCADIFAEYYNKLHFKHMYMVRGNHDFTLFKKLNQRIDEFPRITLVPDYILLEHINKVYLFQHYDFTDTEFGQPFVLNKLVSEGCHIDYLVHGHTHSEAKLSNTNRLDDLEVQNCVCWDAWYKPVNIDRLTLARGY